jgi:hypothetical protein
VIFLSTRELADVFLSFVYICIVVGDPIIKKWVWEPISRFNPSYVCAGAKPGPRFPTVDVTAGQ